MNPEILKQYKSLLEEIKDLEKAIKKLEQEETRVEFDKVTGSNREFPYQPMTYHIEGYDIRKIDRTMRRKELLYKRKDKCEELKVEIEKFINEIDDSMTRRVFKYKYIDGIGWQQIAYKIGKSDESYPRKIIHNKYLEGLK